MSIKKPWFTSNKLIESVKRRISFPLAQETFSEDDILEFANEEMMNSEVPSVLSYHEEYYVYRQEVPLVSNQIRYPIPERALGMRLRGAFHIDSNNNLYELTRVNPEDKAYYQTNIGSANLLTKYYLEGNDFVLTQTTLTSPTGTLLFLYFIRPNQLVLDERASTVASFNKEVTMAVLPTAGDIFYINDIAFTAVASGATSYQFNIAGTIALTAVNLANALNEVLSTLGVTDYTLNNGVFVFNSLDRKNTYTTSNENTFVISDNLGLVFDATGLSAALTTTTDNNDITTVNYISTTADTTLSSTLLSNVGNITGLIQGTPISGSGITDGTTVSEINTSGIIMSLPAATTASGVTIQFGNGVAPKIDFLQTMPGHQIRGFSKDIVSGGYQDNSLYLLDSDVPSTFQMGDYICAENECIIPFLPPELHSILAEKTAGRILSAIGDQQGMAASAAKLQEMKSAEGTLIDNRVDGNPLKITGRHSILRFQKMRNWPR